jgi:predicted Zn-dependent peptidase
MTQQTPAQIDRTKQPEADPPPKASFPPYETFTLSNKLKVFLVHDDRPLVTFRLIVRGGNGVEGDATSLADFAADLLTKGAGTMSAQEFAEKIDFVGGNINASASPDAITVAAGGLRKHLAVILELYADAIKNPTYSQDELEKYRQEQITGLTSAKARPDFLATYAINKLLYGNTAYGRMPSEESMSKITPAMVKQYHDTYFVPNNATLAVVGPLTKDELKQKLEAAFAGWTSKTVPPIKTPTFPDRKKRIVLIDRPSSVQSSIRVVGKGPNYRDKDRPKTFILNSIIGAGTGLGNRLAMNLRETHAYTYTPYSYFDANLYSGRWIAGADVRNSVTDSALTQMLLEIKRMQSENVPADELNRNIQSSVGGFLMSISDPTTTAMRVQSIDFYGLPSDYYSKLVATYSSTTAKDVRDLARKYLSEGDMAVVVVGKASEVKDKLAAFGPVEVWDADLNPVGEPGKVDIGMTAQQVWDKMVAALGGEAAMKKISTLRMTGKISAGTVEQRMNGLVEIVSSAPNKRYFKLDMGIGMMEQFVNGTRAIEVRTAGDNQHHQEIEKQGEDLTKALELAHILPEAYLKETKATIALKGEKEVSGNKAVIVTVTYPKGTTVDYCIDETSFLPIQRETGGQITSYDDWKPEGGVMMPHSMGLQLMGAGMPMRVRDIAYEVNPSVEDSFFR